MGKAINPRTALLPQIRVTPEELGEIRRLAELARQTVSEYVRHRALKVKR